MVHPVGFEPTTNGFEDRYSSNWAMGARFPTRGMLADYNKTKGKCKFIFYIFPIITSSLSIFSVSSFMIDSLLLDTSSVCGCHHKCISESPPTRTRALWRSFWAKSNWFLCFSRNTFSCISGLMMSCLRIVIYLSLSNRFHLLSFHSNFSSLITCVMVFENRKERELKLREKIEKFWLYDIFSSIFILLAISHVSICIFFPILQ